MFNRIGAKYVIAVGIALVLLTVCGGGKLFCADAAPAPALAQSVERTRQPDYSARYDTPRSTETPTHTLFLPLVLNGPSSEPADLPLVQFNSGGYSVHEGEGAATIITTLNAASATTVTVDYATGDGTAQAGSDYVAVSGTQSFAPGQTSQTFTVTVVNDTLDEPDETVILTLSGPENATLGTPCTATLTIVDDDEPPRVQFNSSSYSVYEGTGAATIVTTLNAASATTVTVDYATGDGTAEAGSDYVAASGTQSFAPGQTSGTFTVTIVNDTLDEPDETVLLTLSSPGNATLGTPHTATLTIVDGTLLTVQFSSGESSVGENADTASIIVTLGAMSTLPVTVTYATSDGTAQAGSDYVAASGTLVFAPGQTSRTFTVTVINDTLDEPDETVILTLSGPENAVLGTPHTATLTVVDDDEPLSVQFNSTRYSVGEGTGAATVVATLSAASEAPVTVTYATSAGTAHAGEDYASISGTLIFAPGEVSRIISLEIFDDPFDEPAETFTLTLGSPVNATLGTPGSAIVTIVDDDVPSPFSIQIAALHQVRPGAVALDSGDLVSLQTDAAWLAAYESSFVTLTQALRESGAGWARVRVEWEMIEPDAPAPGLPPTYVWNYHDAKLRLVAQAGVRLIATVTDAPAWAADVPCAPIYPDRLDEYARFLTDLVNRYKGPPYYVKYWELVNEPDYIKPDGHLGGLGCWGNHGDDYAQMLAVAYPAIKAADPEATALMGGVAHDWFTEIGGPFYRYFPDQVMENGGGAFVDVLNFHYFPDFHAEWERWDPRSQDQRYGWLPPPNCGNVYDGQGTRYEASGIDLSVKTTYFRNRMRACFGLDKPVWITELAAHSQGCWGSAGCWTPEMQARYVIQGYARGLAAGAENITWYSLDRAPYDPYYQSLLNDDFSPKPGFYAYKTLTAELTGYTYSHDRNVWVYDGSERGYSYVQEAYVFESASGQEKTAAWGSGTLAFSPAARLRVVDRQGNVTFVTDGGAGDADGSPNGSVQLQLAADPVFAEIIP